MYYRTAITLFLLGVACWGSTIGCWLFIASELALFAGFWKRPVSGVSAFTFMYCLFFAMRPIYLILENDTYLLHNLFQVSASVPIYHRSLLWASLGLICFVAGADLIRRNREEEEAFRSANRESASVSTLPQTSGLVTLLVIAAQFFSFVGMAVLSLLGRGIYRTGVGAYLYDLPNVLQGFQLFAVLFLFERHLQTKAPLSRWVFAGSLLTLLAFTVMMRNVSVFRGFYITGLMVVGLALLFRLWGRVTYKWLVIPIVVFLPLFQWLGQNRAYENKELQRLAAEKETKIFGPSQYWEFFDAHGDMDIFDTFTAATQSKPAYYPYIWSWVYVPLHLIPRAIWDSKPKNGVAQDLTFVNDAPYSPGILGFFLRDGGFVWMLGSMLVLGMAISYLDGVALRLPDGYFKCCCYAIFVVNAMFLTRFFLWQYFYQVLYTLTPCFILSMIAGRQVVTARTDNRIAQPIGVDMPPKKVLGRGIHSQGRLLADGSAGGATRLEGE